MSAKAVLMWHFVNLIKIVQALSMPRQGCVDLKTTVTFAYSVLPLPVIHRRRFPRSQLSGQRSVFFFPFRDTETQKHCSETYGLLCNKPVETTNIRPVHR